MKKEGRPFQKIFTDIGGVLLTNGWDRNSRKLAADTFHLDREDFDARHALAFDIYEQGKISLDDYLEWVVFYKPRTFSRHEFKEFMYAQSKPHTDTMNFFKMIKDKYHLQIIGVSNEGKELMVHRTSTFKLNEMLDFIVCSSFVHMRKPDPGIYKLAIDLAHADPKNSVYIDDRPLLVMAGESVGFRGIVHTSLENTKKQLSEIYEKK